ncbi:hypothetical protein DL96DRAFT_1475929 [Flagelloscypha sp. PMI_526]|nr:hypothetical protein DL96DRAFT_1475929 [Flagelloscypha sp. PMI_526]
MANQTNLKYIVNHVFMPLRLPQKSDQPEEDFSLDHSLARSFSASATRFLQGAIGEAGIFDTLGGRPAWNAALTMLQNFARLHDSYPFTHDELKSCLNRLRNGNCSLPLFIRKQNSCLIFRIVDASVVAEAFTVSLPNDDVTVAFPVTYLQQDEFVTQLAAVLTQLNSEDVEGSKAHIVRAGSAVEEPRSPPSSKYILDWLVVTLSALEPTVAPPTRSITKRTADDILWDSAYLPWRRSPLWLVLRLALELTVGRDGFKVFMVYFMTDLLKQAVHEEFNDELIYLMQGKLARRAVKIETGRGLPEFVRAKFDTVNTQAQDLLKIRWETVLPDLDNPTPIIPWSPSSLDHVGDTVLTLPFADQYIREALSRPLTIQPRLRHDPSHIPRILNQDQIPSILGFTSSFASISNRSDLLLALFDFETHIATKLHNWVLREVQLGVGHDRLRSIFDAMRNYHTTAARVYSGNPEANSQMLLTIFDLWVAIDSLVAANIPLLRRYPCEVSPSLLDLVLLRKRHDLARITRISQYLQSRQAVMPSVFASPKSDSFSLKYFAESSAMSVAMNNIKRQAEVDMTRHRNLLKQRSAEYESLIQKRDATPHHHTVVQRPASQGGQTTTKQGCPRCRLSKQVSARGKKISVYERPLPADDIAAKNLVFELLCPPSFQLWREATFYLLRDVLPLKEPPPPTEVYEKVTSYGSVLGVRNPATATSRLTLASTTKSFYMSHYKERKLPAKETDVIVNHALRWALFDTKSRTLISSRSHDYLDLSLLSALSIEVESYKPLEFSLPRCTHSVTQVLAEHHGCSPSMSTHEYIAYGSLRAGPFVQWLNLATELRSQVLSFNKVPVYQLVIQTVQHVGPADSLGRLSWHSMLDVPSFHTTLLDTMEDLLRIIEGNWQQITTMRSLVEIALRLLGTRFDQRTSAFLARARRILFGWMSGRFSQLQRGAIPPNRIEFHRRRVYEIALACRQTFDVGDELFTHICPTSSELHILLFTHLVIHLVSRTSSEFSDEGSNGTADTILRARDHRLIHKWEDYVRRQCVQDPTAINVAIRSLWPHLETTTQRWSSMTTPNARWIWSTCPARGNVPARLIHFNLLTGQILVDGRSLGALPVEIVQSKPYQTLLANKILHVGPSYLAGSEYMSLSPLNGYLFHFGQMNGKVLIRASPESVSSDVLEFLPGEVFEGDIPRSFIQDYVHWIHLGTRAVEFRPLASLWSESRSHWHLVTKSLSRYQLQQGLDDRDAALLVSRRSHSFLMLFSQVWAIEDVSWVAVVYTPATKGTYPLTLELPRYLLKFLLDRWRLNSVDFPGCFIDSNQGIGTLHGLSSRLVLQESLLGNLASAFPSSRRVLIPNGDFQYVEKPSYMSVTINTKPTTQTRVPYFIYHIDMELGRLSLEESTLESRLYRVYLHALTSRVLPDSLTARLGVEEALNELYSASCITFDGLHPREIELLHAIEGLTPRREFYPRHLRQMQQVVWQSLPSLTQRASFYIRANEILEYDASLKVFHPHQPPKSNESPLTAVQSGSPHLLARAAHRESIIAPLNIMTKIPVKFSQLDVIRPTHLSPSSPSQHYRGARMVATMNDSTPYIFSDGGFKLSKWLQASWPVIVLDPSAMTQSALDFQPSLFDLSALDLRNRWFGMFCTAFKSNIPLATKQFALLFSVSALFYSSSKESQSIAVRLITAAQHPMNLWFRHIQILEGQSVDIRSTNIANTDPISALVLKHKTSDISLPDVEDLARCLIQQYPSQSSTSHQIKVTLPTQFNHHFSQRARSQLTEAVTALYREWQTAVDLRLFLNQTETIFNTSRKSLSGRTQSLPPNSSLPFNRTVSSLVQRVHPVDYLLESISSSDPPTFKPTPTLTIDGLKEFSSAFGSVGTDADTKLENVIQRLFKLGLPIPMHFALELKFSKNELLASGNPVTTSSKGSRSLLDLALSPTCPHQHRLHATARWPQPTLLSLISRLTWIHWDTISQAWKEVFVELCLRLISVHQCRRILRAVSAPDDIPVRLPPDVLPFPRSLALYHPDWLLVQIESNILARPHQLGIATEMFQPTSGSNATLQLNMGEGKSSVIVPFVASSLADGNQLVRVVSLKPLIRSMMTILTNRVASLPNRRVAYFPFSRDILRQPGDIFGQLSKLYTKLKQDHGILLAQPEHILSPKLLSIERILSGDSRSAQSIAASRFFSQIQNSARDILDECDEELSVSFQLIYTLGEPIRFDWHPHRWLLIQQILTYCIGILANLSTVSLLFPEPWSFPHFFCRTRDAIDIISAHMNDAIGQQLCFDQVFGVSLAHLTWTERRLAVSFATQRHPTQEAIALVDGQHRHLRNALLVLRGLLAFKILPYCLAERRWRVDYGLDPRRSMVAIPFKANDVPSPASEFAHPDLVIVLSCLAYHYYGLTDAQVKDSLAHLLTLSNPMAHYSRWVYLIPPERLPLHAPARHVSGINLDDKDQLDMLCILLRQNRTTVDFYLQEFVFPKSAKSFPHKIQTSGWDLAEKRHFLTTGFSGTKDNSPLLPQSINFLQTPGQAGTNAMVLLHVLNTDNSVYFITPPRPTGRDLVDLIIKVASTVRVLLDVGAQVLDKSNLEMVDYWLSQFTAAEAAIYFNEKDELSVLRRDRSTEPFQSSTYRQQTSKCVVYLDDAHTRGTDLKLPRNWKAAVTLGKKVTKDRLVQGCMRMRQLASGQTLVFFAPPEVDNAIRIASNKTMNDLITVEDVVMWAMLETCRDIEHNAPVWAIQGLDYQQRRNALDAYKSRENLASLRETWLQPETKSLHDMFHPEVQDERLHRAFDIPALEKNLTRLGITHHTIHSSNMDEEQEREVTHEVEAEPEISPPAPLIPVEPFFNRALIRLVCNGELSRDSFLSVDRYLQIHFGQQWSECKQLSRNVFHQDFLVSIDFTRTIKDGWPAEFMQPVRWILLYYPTNSLDGPVLIVLSQFEANSLLPYMNQFRRCKLHSFVAAVSPAVKPFDEFNFFPIPADANTFSTPLPQKLITQLNLFAGQLYPRSYQHYLLIAQFLGFDITRRCRSMPDGFVPPASRFQNPSLMRDCAFTKSPLPFLKQLFSLRRKSQRFHDTPVGILLSGWFMSEEEFGKVVVNGLGAMGL